MRKDKLFHNSKIKNMKKNSLKSFSDKFENIFQEINKKIDDTGNIFNLFNQNYEFSFKIKILHSLKNLKKLP